LYEHYKQPGKPRGGRRKGEKGGNRLGPIKGPVRPGLLGDAKRRGRKKLTKGATDITWGRNKLWGDAQKRDTKKVPQEKEGGLRKG